MSFLRSSVKVKVSHVEGVHPMCVGSVAGRDGLVRFLSLVSADLVWLQCSHSSRTCCLPIFQSQRYRSALLMEIRRLGGLRSAWGGTGGDRRLLPLQARHQKHRNAGGMISSVDIIHYPQCSTHIGVSVASIHHSMPLY